MTTWLEVYSTGTAAARSSASGQFVVVSTVDLHDLNITVRISPRTWRAGAGPRHPIAAAAHRTWSARPDPIERTATAQRTWMAHRTE